MKKTVRIHSFNSLWIYAGGHLIETLPIDKTFDAVYWARRLKMEKAETVTAETGEQFTIYRKGTELHTAIPV